jgi:hypothetical protein
MKIIPTKEYTYKDIKKIEVDEDKVVFIFNDGFEAELSFDDFLQMHFPLESVDKKHES